MTYEPVSAVAGYFPQLSSDLQPVNYVPIPPSTPAAVSGRYGGLQNTVAVLYCGAELEPVPDGSWRQYRYELACGHTVYRHKRGRARCVCERCKG